MSLFLLFILIFMLAIVNTILAGVHVRAFVSQKDAIDSRKTLDEFKKMVTQQMYQALLQLVLLGSTVLLGMYGIFTGKLSLFIVLLLNGIIIGLSMIFKSVEKRARSLKVEDELLQKEYLQVCEAWTKKALPTF